MQIIHTVWTFGIRSSCTKLVSNRARRHSMVFNVLVTFGIYDQFFARELLILRNGCGPGFVQLGSSKAAQL
ncbi:hypothetical protein V6N12_019822 [Hibiscus sabdariffa]|uniref:Uncharacterized protein n=1 Tax=Hibiscus sabdariffa TaxID=183260 RepID=A0ABR2ARG7_9ROSI